MPVSLEQVRAALAPEEPNYRKAAEELGTEALPHLEALLAEGHPMLAAKATYLASLIDGDKAGTVLEKAAASLHETVRVAAAAAARHLPTGVVNALLVKLVNDDDPGVRKAALQSVALGASEELHLLVARVAGREMEPHVQRASLEALRRLAGGSPVPVAATGEPAVAPSPAPRVGHVFGTSGTRAPRVFGTADAVAQAAPAPGTTEGLESLVVATAALQPGTTKGKRTKAAKPRAEKKPAQPKKPVRRRKTASE